MVAKGSKMSEESRAKMRLAALSRPSNRIGKKHTMETRELISRKTRERTPRGDQCHTFIDGKGVERHNERWSSEYKQWKYDVKLRDGFICQHCGYAKGGILHSHHIKPFSLYPELRSSIDNGITLCIPCHKSVHRAIKEGLGHIEAVMRPLTVISFSDHWRHRALAWSLTVS